MTFQLTDRYPEKPRLNVVATYALRASASSTRTQTAQVPPAGDQSEHTAKPESCDVSGHCEPRTIVEYIRRANAFKRHLGSGSYHTRSGRPHSAFAFCLKKLTSKCRTAASNRRRFIGNGVEPLLEIVDPTLKRSDFANCQGQDMHDGFLSAALGRAPHSFLKLTPQVRN